MRSKVGSPSMIRAEISYDGSLMISLSGGTGFDFRRWFVLDDRRLAAQFGRAITPLAADIIDVSGVVYIIDRHIPKHWGTIRRARSERAHVSVTIPVRLPELWNQVGIVDAMGKVLNYLTEMEWEIDFAQRLQPQRISEQEQPHYLIDREEQGTWRAALNSGGQDSVMGAYLAAQQSPDERLLLVSAQTNPAKALRREHLVQELRRLFGKTDSIAHVSIAVDLRRLEAGSGIVSEFTCRPPRLDHAARTRGFLFLGFGAAAALMAGSNSIDVYENGIGAINLSLAGEIGAENSRSVHPRTLRLMGEMISKLAGSRFSYNLPFLYMSKSQVCELLPEEAKNLVLWSISCDRFPFRSPRRRYLCGRCTSCMLRRISLTGSGREDWDREETDWYAHDVLAPDGHLLGSDLLAFRATIAQAAVIDYCLQQSDPWFAMVQRFPELERVANSEANKGSSIEQVRQAFLDLYRRHVRDVDYFATHARWR